MSDRTAMTARALTGRLTTCAGASAVVYVLARATDGTLEEIGSTSAALVRRQEGGGYEVRLTEDATIDRVALMRAVAVAAPTGPTGYRLHQVSGRARQALGQASREWVLAVGRAGAAYEPAAATVVGASGMWSFWLNSLPRSA